MREAINPPTLHPSVQLGFSHVVVGRGSRTIYCAGQVAWNAQGNLVGKGDFAAQFRQALENVRLALAAAGAKPEHVTRMHTYIVNHTAKNLDVVSTELKRFYDGALPAANSLIGVQTLAVPDFLVEIEVTAVLD